MPRATINDIGPGAEKRFKAKYEEAGNGCWLWQASLDEHGYGQFWYGSALGSAHRFAYEFYKGAIPVGLELDHLCRVHNCVNPAHLEAVSSATNHLRGASARKTHCVHGHPLSGDNLYLHPKNGRRGCVTCRRRQAAECHARKAGMTYEEWINRPKEKTHCVNGHPYAPDNAYFRVTKERPNGFRLCRTCVLEQNRKQREKRKEVA
jgi:hypothetical protein